MELSTPAPKADIQTCLSVYYFTVLVSNYNSYEDIFYIITTLFYHIAIHKVVDKHIYKHSAYIQLLRAKTFYNYYRAL